MCVRHFGPLNHLDSANDHLQSIHPPPNHHPHPPTKFPSWRAPPFPLGFRIHLISTRISTPQIRNNSCNAVAVRVVTDEVGICGRGGIRFTNCAREHAREKRKHQEGENSLHRGHVCRLHLSHTEWHGDTRHNHLRDTEQEAR